MKLVSVLKVVCCVSCISFFLSCSNDGHDKENNLAEDKDSLSASVDTSSITDEEQNVQYTLPSPLQIASILKKSGLIYFPGLTNDLGQATKYNSNEVVKSLNLGVYTADMTYCMLNKKYQESKNYLKTCRDMATQLGLSKGYDDNNLTKRFEANIEKTDSLVGILAEIQLQTDMILEENKREHISVLTFTGAWVESMYVASQVYSKDKTSNMSSKLVEQMTIANSIVKALEASKAKIQDADVLINDIKGIRDVYTNFEAVKKLENTDEDVDFSTLKISAEELAVLTQKITETRAKIIKG